jgi:ATP-dependent Clp protease protease subunit
VNCYGGSVPAGLGVLDVVRTVNDSVPVHTYCLGECVGVAIAIVAAGRAHHRFAFPSARFSLYQEWYGVESVWGAQSQDHDERTRLMKVVEAALRSRTRLAELQENEFSKHLTTLKFFDADLAVQYGIVDAIEGKVAMPATALPVASSR